MNDEERQQRIHHHMYETCEGIAEHAERIVALEELCADMWRFGFSENSGANSAAEWDKEAEAVADRMDELGVPRGQ